MRGTRRSPASGLAGDYARRGSPVEMPDDPRNRPPPLPPRPLVPEPFRLTATPPSGGVTRGHLLPHDPRDRLIEEMRAELAALRPLVSAHETAAPEPPPPRQALVLCPACYAMSLMISSFDSGTTKRAANFESVILRATTSVDCPFR